MGSAPVFVVLLVVFGGLIGGLARILLPGRRDLSASATILAGVLGAGTLGAVAGRFTGRTLSLLGAVAGAAVFVLLAEWINRRRARQRWAPAATLIEAGESDRVEFKSTARYNLRTQAKDPVIELVIARSVAGFANAGGGTLLIGVADDGKPLGLDADLALVKGGDLDGFELWLFDMLERCLGHRMLKHVRVRFEDVTAVSTDGSTARPVCRVDVELADVPVYLRPHAGDRRAQFHVRRGNATRQLDVDDAVDYVGGHWANGPLTRLGHAWASKRRSD